MTQRHRTATLHVISDKGPQCKILIVDNRWENRSVLMNFLESVVFAGAKAQHGQEALTMLHTDRPDLGLTDLAMPVMDGYKRPHQPEDKTHGGSC